MSRRRASLHFRAFKSVKDNTNTNTNRRFHPIVK